MDELRSIPLARTDTPATRRSESGAVLVTTFGGADGFPDPRTLKRLDDRREPGPKARRDYDELFEFLG